MQPVDRTVSEERALWLSRHALPHEAALRAWLTSRRLPGVDIEDVIQETYARLIQARNLDGVQNPKAYLYRTAWSVLMTHLRREKVVALQAAADIEQFALEADQPSPEQQAADREELLRLAEAIASLPARVGDVFRLRRVHGYSQKEVARRLGLAESTVEKHMRRGLVLLLERFTRGGYPAPAESKVAKKGVNHGDGPGQRKSNR